MGPKRPVPLDKQPVYWAYYIVNKAALLFGILSVVIGVGYYTGVIGKLHPRTRGLHQHAFSPREISEWFHVCPCNRLSRSKPLRELLSLIFLPVSVYYNIISLAFGNQLSSHREHFIVVSMRHGMQKNRIHGLSRRII